MKPFMDRDFLLDTPMARRLFHGYAECQPIFDYHNHLSPKDIAEHRSFQNLTELWLEGDHYKWRAMRACGVDERRITGDAAPQEKFAAWAETLPRLVGSPLYYWTHLELQRYFGIDTPLTPNTAERIWYRTEEQLRSKGFDAVSLLERMNVRGLCTTDDPADTLEWHRRIREDVSIRFAVYPSFRPDRYLTDPNGAASRVLCERCEASTLDAALEKALDHFCENGCLVADHGLSTFPYGKDQAFSDRLRRLGVAYARRGMVMQLHLGALRNNSPRLWRLIGADAGGDSVGDTVFAAALGTFLGDLEEMDALPRTVLYNLNPADNAVFAAMAGNFAPQVQYGAAWWFNDHLRGIERQLDELMEAGALAASVGMLTDSRSLTSFVRHEFFRRILCRKLGRLAEEGLYPDDEVALGRIVQDVCYGNATRFFAPVAEHTEAVVRQSATF